MIVFWWNRAYKKSKFIKLIWVLISVQEIGNVVSLILIFEWKKMSFIEVIDDTDYDITVNQVQQITYVVNMITHWIFAC